MISTTAYEKSSHSGGDGCVEVRLLDDGTIGVRDSKNLLQPALVFTPVEWRAFVAGIRGGEFDLPSELA